MKEKKYCIDVFTDVKKSWMNPYSPVRVSSPTGSYYTLKGNKTDRKKIIRECARRNIRTRSYETRWARDTSYRNMFLKNTSPPYYCRYCGKKISPSQMQVDHIVPVAAVKKSLYARWLLGRQGITNVNDIRNLAPSCRRCNRRKGTKMGIWLLRARLGKNPNWFRTRRILRAVIGAILLLVVLYLSFVL